MQTFPHLPEYAAAASSYRLERTVVRRSHQLPATERVGILARLTARLHHPAMVR